jgi:hypothetical protein
MPRLLASLTLVLALGGVAGCSELYCQSGPKYGTQCYSINEVEWQETMVAPPPPPQRSTQPSPGCALLTPNGVYTMSQNPNATATPTPPYLMSGACVTRRQPVAASIR